MFINFFISIPFGYLTKINKNKTPKAF